MKILVIRIKTNRFARFSALNFTKAMAAMASVAKIIANQTMRRSLPGKPIQLMIGVAKKKIISEKNYTRQNDVREYQIEIFLAIFFLGIAEKSRFHAISVKNI